MSLVNTLGSLVTDLTALGLRPKQTVMVHSSLGKVEYTVGGSVVVIRALLQVLTPQGTLVMPAESPSMSDPAHSTDSRIRPEWHDLIREHLPVFDPRTTPTTMGAIPDAFRTYPGTQRSSHPLVSVCANGPHAGRITAEHALEFGEGRGTPFQKLYDLDAYTLLLGVGFDRCTSLHYAESLVPRRPTALSRFPIMRDGNRVWVEKRDMAADNGVHFPIVGKRFVEDGHVHIGEVGDAESMLFSTKALVDFAAAYFREALE
jgi:aminoglycoside 3-N-acetyltransferase